MNKVIRQFGVLRKSEEDNRTIKFTFSTSAKDRHRTVLNKDGWMLDNFNKNGIAGYMHDVYGDGLLAKPDPDDVIGKARAWVEGDDLVGEITFEPKDLNEKADKVYRKIQFGSLNAVSVGFIEKGAGQRGNPEDGEDPEAYYFAGQELLEISVVNIPSNPEALKNRDFVPYNDHNFKTDLTKEVTKSIKMEKDEKRDLAPESKVKEAVEPQVVKLDVSGLEEAIVKGVTGALEQSTKKVENIPGPAGSGLSDQEKRELGNYSITRAIRGYANSMTGRGKFDGIEKEMHEEAEKEMKASKLELQGIGVPSIIHSRADLKATVDAQGGYTVATDLVGLIPTLRNNMASIQAGAQLLTNLTGDVAMPRRASDSTATWRSEGGVSTQSDPTYEQVTLSPNRLTTHTEFTHQLLRQSSIDVEAEVRDVLFYAIANALETAIYAGSGSSNQPTGILNATGVNDADHGSNGTILSWANVVQMEKMVAVDNALKAKLAYITNATAAAKMKVTKKDTYQGGWIWENFTPLTKGMVNGYDAYITNTISSSITRGTNTDCSAVIFGDWSQVMIGQWGAVDLIVNPYSLDTYGTVRVVVAGYYDIAIKQPSAFAAIAGLEN
jgi:HK97 family phage major capsid protein/HK97 family phage prohead protease